MICEYLGEGAIEPMRMIRSGQHKYIAVNGYPAQLFDLAKDPEETRNFAGDRGYAPVERMLETRCERDWDGPALKEAVMRSQQERILIGSMKDYGGAPKWDYDAEIPGRFRF